MLVESLGVSFLGDENGECMVPVCRSECGAEVHVVGESGEKCSEVFDLCHCEGFDELRWGSVRASSLVVWQFPDQVPSVRWRDR